MLPIIESVMIKGQPLPFLKANDKLDKLVIDGVIHTIQILVDNDQMEQVI